MTERINVTKTFLPPIAEYQAYIQKIWEADQITNQGPLLSTFEKQISKQLSVRNFQFVANGTIALQLALRALGVTEGEVITTPFTYVATVSSILWEHCEPTFVDIDPKTLCIDVEKIEAAITPRTRAIMPVHVFGNPCDVEKIGEIAKKHNLKVIYDGAHAFGAEYKGKSLLSYGDISTCSFHATKLFHTIEGGGLVVSDPVVSEKVELMKRFGHNGDDHFMLGVNAKASEFQAAMGLCNLKYLNQHISKRKEIKEFYNANLPQEMLLEPTEDLKPNYAYMPVLFKSESQLKKIVDALNSENIYPRRYFYPSLNQLPYLETKQSCPISEDIASRILCLPLHAFLAQEDLRRICKIITKQYE